MSEQILVPALGESVTEATVSKWLKGEGENVNADEPVVELETDKVNVEVPAPSSGKIEKISVKEGETVNVGALLGSIIESANGTEETVESEKKYAPPKKIENNVEQIAEVKLEKVKKKAVKKTVVNKEVIKKEVNKEEITEPLILTEIHSEIESKQSTNPIASPAARKIIEEKKIDIS